MDYIIKKASALTVEEQTSRGILGIPQDWPIEQYVYNDSIPEGFELISDVALEDLKLNHQVEYDAWLQSLRPINPEPSAPIVKIDTPEDADGRQLVRVATTNAGWIYSPRSLDFYTAKYNSLYNKDHEGAGIDDSVDMGDTIQRFFDQSGLELIKGSNESAEDFQIRLSQNCIKTVVDFEPQYDIDIYGAKLMVKTSPMGRAYFWAIVAPDIPKAYGGSIPFMGGGWNLQMIEPRHICESDGKSSKTIHYDSVYHSGKIRLLVKHELGEVFGMQVLLEYYKAK